MNSFFDKVWYGMIFFIVGGTYRTIINQLNWNPIRIALTGSIIIIFIVLLREFIRWIFDVFEFYFKNKSDTKGKTDEN